MLQIIIRNITQRKLRTGLTIFGIALSIFAIVAMGGMSEYFNLTVDRSISLTADKIRVMPEGGGFRGGGLDESKIMDVKKVPGITDAYGILSFPINPENTGIMLNVDLVFGISPDKQELLMRDTKLTSGRLLVPGEGYGAIIGSNIAREFNLKEGDELEIKKQKSAHRSSIHTKNFTVVGIFEYTGSFLDNVVQVPLDRAQKFYGQEGKISFIHVIPDLDTDPEALLNRIELTVDEVKTFSPKQLRAQIEASLIVFSLITLSTAVLAAIIGGLIVMNTMLMSISERTKEFGLMRAMGAESKDILFITLGEATLIGIIGGIIGIVGGSTFVYYLNEYLASKGTVLFTITPRLLILAIIFASVLGTLSGIYPAYRATKMRPMEALRYM